MTEVRALRKSVPWRPEFASESPLFAPLIEPARAFATFAEFPTPEEIDRLLAPVANVRFVRSQPPPARQGRIRRENDLYDANIHRERSVPTRDGSWHDFLNALIWCLFPRAKMALHARQHALVARGLDAETGKLPGARTPEQDALALFDEGGLVVASDLPLPTGEAIEAALDRRTARGIVFGHAIYESFVLGVPWPTVRAIVVSGDELDAALSRVLEVPGALSDPEVLPRVRLTPLLRSAPTPSATAP
jgi:hypothetical protein